MSDRPGTPLLSVVLPNYNHARFLEAAVGSIFAQSLLPDEVIIIDDASTDGISWPLIGSIASRHGMIRAERNPANLGVVRTINRGLALARGRYIHFAAADDVIAPDFYARCLPLLCAHPAAGLCSALSVIIDAGGRFRGLLPIPIVADAPAFLPPERCRDLLGRVDSWFMGNVSLFRREALLDVGGFREELRSFCDSFASRAVAARYGACFVPAALGAWRRMDAGFAARSARDLTWMGETLGAVQSLMTGPFAQEFSPQLRNRWAGRWRYAMVQTAIGLGPAAGAAVLGTFPRPRMADRVATRILPRFGRTGLRALQAYAFMCLRGGSLPLTLAMRLKARLRRARYEAPWRERGAGTGQDSQGLAN